MQLTKFLGLELGDQATASKHAVVGLTRAAALEVATKNVRVNAIAPGTVDTPMFEKFATDPAIRDFVTSMHPLGRIARPEEIAGAVVFLASAQAAFMTGHTLVIDGGFSVG
jgi:NAD(P)-dependent dehydrogenase (short-subunit alcohol dehydrogenase family)